MSEGDTRQFRPELLMCRGEVNAWLFAGAAIFCLIILHQTLEIVPAWTWSYSGFLVLSALSIFFRNWMDRQTSIALDIDGLRSVRLSWSEVQKAAFLPARWGKSVQVVGENDHFDFKTLGEVQFQSKIRSQIGFSEGKAILNEILRNSGLVLVEESGNAYRYARR